MSTIGSRKLTLLSSNKPWYVKGIFSDQNPWFVLDALNNRAMVRTGVVGGTELVTNGTFNTDLTSWTDASTGGASVSVSGSAAVFSVPAGTGNLRQAITTVAGQLYEVTRTGTLATAGFSIGTTAGGTEILASLASGATARFIARGTTTYVNATTTTNGVTLDNVSVKAVLPSTVISGTPEQLITAGYLTYSRSDAFATRESAPGVWSQVAANTLRRKYDGSIYIEPSVTNSVRNPRCVGASASSNLPTHWSTGGFTGVTVSVEGTGTENGIDYVDIRMVSASTGGTFGLIFLDASQIAAALNTEVWSALIFKKLSSGSLSNIDSMSLQLRQQDSGGTGLGDLVVSSFTPTSSLTSSSGTVTCNQASTAYLRPFIGAYWSAGVAIDCTLRLGWPQEQKSGAITTPIVPAVGGTGATTRAADAFALNTANLYMTGDGTIVGEATTAYATNPAATSMTNHIFGLANNTPSNNYAIVRLIDSNHNGWVVFSGDGSTVAGAETGNGVAANTRTRVAYRFKATAADSAVSGNGGASAAIANKAYIYPPINSGSAPIGGGGSAYMTGTVRYLAVLGKALSNAELAVESARYA